MHFKSVIIVGLLLTQPLHAAVLDRVAIVVNDDVVTQSEIFAMDSLKTNLSGLPEEPDRIQERIDHHLILQQILKQPPLTVSEDDVQTAIGVFVKEHRGTEETMLFLHTIGMNYADLEREIRQELSIREFINLRFRPFVSVTLEDAEKYYNETYKPELEKEGKPILPFAESFDDVQKEIVEVQMQDRIKAWLKEIRASASISVKN